MGADDVLSLYLAFEAAGAPVWLMGGWGIDALLGRQTRAHHDVDVLVGDADLERLRLCLIDLGFGLKYVWGDEARWICDDAWTSPLEQPTAFVYEHPDGREVDVHVVRRSNGAVEPLWNVPYVFTRDSLDAVGVIDGHPVRCLSREMQRTAHTGYAVAAEHRRDLELLDEPT